MIQSSRKPPWPLRRPAPVPVMRTSLRTPCFSVAAIKIRVAAVSLGLFRTGVLSKRGIGELSQGTIIITTVAAAEEIEVATFVRLENVLEVHFPVSS